MFQIRLTLLCLSLLLTAPTSFAASTDLDYQLYDAVLYGDTTMMDELLAKGANPNHTENNRSLLTWAAQSGLVEVAEKLIAAGSDINAVDGIEQTPLMRAVEIVDVPMVKALLAAEPDIEMSDTYGQTVAMMASAQGRIEIVEALLGAGADFDTIDEEGNSPLLLVVIGSVEERDDIIKLFGAAGVDLDYSSDYYTALSYAIEQDDTSLVKVLLDAGADPNVKTPNGNAPLPDAGSNREISKMLLNAGADPNTTNKWQETALFTVIEYGSTDDLQALIDAGADVNHKESNGQTPMGRANALNKPEMVKLLEQNGGTRSGEPQAISQKQETPSPTQPMAISNSLAALSKIKPVEVFNDTGIDVTYYTSATLKEATDFYLVELPQDGWTAGDTLTDDETYVSLKFRKDGELVTLTINATGTDESSTVMVSLLAHGEFDASKLPHYSGSTTPFAQETNAIYNTEDEMELVANETLKLLHQAGWEGSVTSVNQWTHSLKLTKGGSTLMATVSRAPGDANPTTISYSLQKTGN